MCVCIAGAGNPLHVPPCWAGSAHSQQGHHQRRRTTVRAAPQAVGAAPRVTVSNCQQLLRGDRRRAVHALCGQKQRVVTCDVGSPVPVNCPEEGDVD